MQRLYEFTWYNKRGRGDPILRHNRLVLTTAEGNNQKDCYSAIQLFMRSFGNLNKNEIVSIQEYDMKTDKPIYDPIVPGEQPPTGDPEVGNIALAPA